MGDYLINMVVLCSGQAPRTGFRVRGAVCVAGDGSDLSPPGSVTLLCSPGSCSSGCCAAHLELQILQKTELGSHSPLFIRPFLGFELCDEC